MVRVSKNPEERKSEIINMAEKLFVEQGYENTTVSSIANNIGIAKGTFYYYFKTKEDIISELLKRRLDKGKNIAMNIINNEDFNAINKLLKVMRILIMPSPEDNRLFNYFDPDKNPKIHQKRDELFHEVFKGVILDIVREGINEGLFKLENYEEITEIIFIGIDGFMHRNIIKLKDKEKLKDKIAAIQELLEKVLGCKKGSLNILD